MAAPILIVGQGLAGSLLAWEFERAGIDFEVVDRGHAEASSRVGAGIINPITGQRIVKSRGIDEWLPSALATYREMEVALAVPLVRAQRVRRLFNGDRERAIFAEKSARGELAPYAGTGDDDGFWIEGAARVDIPRLIAAMRARLVAAGRLREADESGETMQARGRDLSIWCVGASAGEAQAETGGRGGLFAFAGLRPAKGELLTIAVAGLDPEVILNRGHWVLPVSDGVARVGATFEPGVADLQPTAEARAHLERSAAAMLAREFTVLSHEVGLRMTTTDRHPVVGRSADDSRVGVFNGLGSKGALLAPRLARQWVNHLTEGVPFDAAVDVARFAR